MDALRLEHLTIDYEVAGKTQRAVNDLSLTVKEGEIFGFLGPNGAGKTSVISAITSLLQNYKGSISLFDQAAGTLQAKRWVGLVPQEVVGYGFFTVEEILLFHAGYFAIENRQERVDWLLEKMALSAMRNKKVAQLSGGMKRRLLIARALIHSPRLLLLDEPSAGVDVELREDLWNFVRELHQSGTTILLTTHYMEEAERLCDRVAILDHGRLVTCGPTQSLVGSFGMRRIEIELLDPARKIQLRAGSVVRSLNQQGSLVVVTVPTSLSVGEVLTELSLTMEDLKDIRTCEAKLEDVFKQLIHQNLSAGQGH
jgi:ABC-2 type transport system ATP-binding protein